eukprot:6190203-Pleurochrysis_carterae.AAC.1
MPGWREHPRAGEQARRRGGSDQPAAARRGALASSEARRPPAAHHPRVRARSHRSLSPSNPFLRRVST